MANRKITQFPSINPGDINDSDLLTTVSVFEVDPALRNKKITFSGFREYLDIYYININELNPFVVNNLTVTGFLNVSGLATLASGIVVNGDSFFSQDVTITGNLTLLSGLTVTGDVNIDGNIDVDFVTTDGLEVQGNATIQQTITGSTANFVSGNFDRTFTTFATGLLITYVSGEFSNLQADDANITDLTVDNVTVSGITITGDLISSGTIIANDINVTGTL